jgi:NTP pyrophosphatase (non-canonical NTP hydrolase)
MPESGIGDLLRIMATLRDPERGCPWDLKQDFATIAPYTIEDTGDIRLWTRIEDIDTMDSRGIRRLCPWLTFCTSATRHMISA